MRQETHDDSRWRFDFTMKPDDRNDRERVRFPSVCVCACEGGGGGGDGNDVIGRAGQST